MNYARKFLQRHAIWIVILLVSPLVDVIYQMVKSEDIAQFSVDFNRLLFRFGFNILIIVVASAILTIRDLYRHGK